MKDNIKLFYIMTEDGDIQRVSKKSPELKYVTYEVRRLVHFNNNINRITNSDKINALIETEKTLYGSNILSIIQEILNSSVEIQVNFEQNACQNIPSSYTYLCSLCKKFQDMICDLILPIVKPRWFENSDDGPGVGVSNVEVKFRPAELSILYDRDYSCPVHSTRGNSGDSEAERTNSAAGDNIVDGATLQWNKYQRFHSLSDEEISQLTV